MPCSKEAALLSLFYNLSSFSFLLFLFLYSSSILLINFLNFIGSYPLIHRNQNEYDYGLFSEEDEEEEEEEEGYNYNQSYRYYKVGCTDRDQRLVGGMIQDSESRKFLHNNSSPQTNQNGLDDLTSLNHDQPVITSEDQEESSYHSTEQVSGYDETDLPDDDVDSLEPEISSTQQGPTSPIIIELDSKADGDVVEKCHGKEIDSTKPEVNFSRDEKFLVLEPRQSESKRWIVHEKEDDGMFGDSCTVGSTSKSSSEWRSSINCRDSGTEDPFSSSSRRSCPKWESYTVFQKYDEEMMFLDRISAQKLHETESLRSIQVCPRSISERIVHKIATMNKKEATDIRQNPYRELEATYVAQICLTWEALNWNYKNFQHKRASRRNFDPGCSASIAQQFQQFQVLLQRYIENEPYEQGRRPEVYARMRLLAPKLLLVPEYRDSDDDDQKDEGFGSRISTAAFLMIMEDGIRTFMNFLKADKERPCQIIKSFFGRTKRGSVDPTLLNLMKKVNTKKKMKLKELRRGGKCIRKKKLKVEEEMEIVMGLIDLRVVSRVLRMKDLSEEQLHWCEEKMSKVRVMDGKLQRDSSPLFFPPTH